MKNQPIAKPTPSVRSCRLRANELLLLALSVVSACAPPASQAAGIKDMLPQIKRQSETPAVRDKWALLIGVDRFEDAGLQANAAAAKNVETMAAALLDPHSGRFAKDHVKVLTGAAATSAGIEESVNEWLCKKALPADFVIVYIASQLICTDYGSPAFLPADARAAQVKAQAIGVPEVLTELRRRLQSKNILCILDAQVVPPEDRALASCMVPDLATSGASVISPAPLHKSSPLAPTGHSIFVDAFAEALRASGGTIVLADIVTHAQSKLGLDSSGKSAKSIFCPAADALTIAQVHPGMEIRTPVAAPTVALGYSLDKLALTRPDVVAPRHATPPKPAAKPKVTKSADGNLTVDDPDDDGVDPTLDLGSYMKLMKETIQKSWHPPKALTARKLIAVFSIRKDGAIVNASILEGSGAPDVDRSALEALKAASPLAPLPKGSPEAIDIKYSFDWKTSTQ